MELIQQDELNLSFTNVRDNLVYRISIGFISSYFRLFNQNELRTYENKISLETNLV